MLDLQREHTLLLGEYPVASGKFKTAKRLTISTAIGSVCTSLAIAVSSILFAPPEVLTVKANPEYCPGSLKVSLKTEHDLILTCTNSPETAPLIIIDQLSSVLQDGTYKVVAVLEDDEKDLDPEVVATLPSISDSDSVRQFVSNAMNISNTDIVESAAYYWGIGDTENANLGLFEGIMSAGVSNPAARIDDSIMQNLASVYATKRSIDEFLKPANTVKSKEDVKSNIATVTVETKGKLSYDCSGTNCEAKYIHYKIIDLVEGIPGKILTIMMILLTIVHSIIRPSLILFSFGVASVLLISNLPNILRTMFGI